MIPQWQRESRRGDPGGRVRTATVDAAWLSIPAGGGMGPGEFPYGVASMDPAATFPIRQGRIRLRWSTATAGQDVLITQAIGTCRIQGAHFIEWNGTAPRTFGPGICSSRPPATATAPPGRIAGVRPAINRSRGNEPSQAES